MAFIKQCLNCSNKGMFLKLIDGLCEECKKNLEGIENEYSKILQCVATNPERIPEIIPKLKQLIDDLCKYKISSNKIKLSDCIDLLTTITNKNSNANNIDKSRDIFDINVESFSKKDFNQEKIVSLNTEPINIPNIINIDTQISDIKKIRNVIEPDFIEESNQSINFQMKSKSLNQNVGNNSISLTLSNVSTEKVINHQQESMSKKAEDLIREPVICVAETLVKNSLIKKLNKLIDNTTNIHISTNELGKFYFELKKEVEQLKNESAIKDMDLIIKIEEALEDAKKTLCIRIRKDESELFSFFNFVSISIQTTGLSPTTSDIIEISACKVCYGNIVDKFYSLVNPIKSIKLSVTKTTKISNDDVVNAPTIDILLPKLLEFIGDFKLISHNSKFINSFLNFNLRKLHNSDLKIDNICTMKLYRIRYKNYHGVATPLFDISSCCLDLLTDEDVKYINSFKSVAQSNSHGIYKIYEVLKYRYK